ncbi:DUF2897 family protein [Thalassotalea piscium]|nr:DUF2897 family protein [Thalassotalea piscium]
MYVLFIIILAVCLIIGGIMLVKQSAKKFNLTDDQLKKVQARQKAQEIEDKKD